MDDSVLLVFAAVLTGVALWGLWPAVRAQGARVRRLGPRVYLLWMLGILVIPVDVVAHWMERVSAEPAPALPAEAQPIREPGWVLREYRERWER